MSGDKVKTKYITAFYGVFLATVWVVGFLFTIQEEIEKERQIQRDIEKERLVKVIAKLEAQDSGLVEKIGTDEELAKKILEQSIKLREQAYKLDPKLKDGK